MATEIIWNGNLYHFKCIVSRLQALSKIYIKTTGEHECLPGFVPCVDPLAELRESADRIHYGSVGMQRQLVEVLTSLSADGMCVEIEDTATSVVEHFSNSDIMDRARVVRKENGTLRLTLLRLSCPLEQRARLHIPLGKKPVTM